MRQYRSPLTGRDGEVRETAEVLRTAGTSARTLLVTGGAGAGKTAVLEQARRVVVQEGGRVLRLDWEAAAVVAAPAGTAVLAEVVRAVLARMHDGRLPARGAAIRRARSRAVGPGPEVALLSTLGEVLADAARQLPFALVLDDVQRMPAPTASALGLLLRAFRPAGVPVVLAGRPMSPGHGTGAQLVAAADRVLELRPLSRAEAAELVVRRLGGPVDAELVTEVLRALGPLAGSPGAVLSVLASLEERDELLELDGQVCLTVPPDGLRLAGEVTELGRLGWPDGSPGAGALTTAATLARLIGRRSGPGLDDLRRGVSPDGAPDAVGGGLGGPLGVVGRGLDGLVRDRVVTVDRNGRPTFVVPALASALRALPGTGRSATGGGGGRGGWGAGQDGREPGPGARDTCPGRPGSGPGGSGSGPGGSGAGPGAGGSGAGPGAGAGGSGVVGSAVGRGGGLLEEACDVLGVPSPVSVRADPVAGGTSPGELLGLAGSCLRYGDHPGVLALGEPLLTALGGPADAADRTALLRVTRAWVLAALHEHRSPYDEDADPRYRAALRRMPSATELAALGGPYGIGPRPPTAGGAEPVSASPESSSDAFGGVYGIGPQPSTDGPGIEDVATEAASPVPSSGEVRLLAAAVGGRVGFARVRGGLDDVAADGVRNAAGYGDLVGGLRAVLGERYAGAGRSAAERYHVMVRDYLAGDWDGALSGARRIEARGRSGGAAGVVQTARALAAEIQLMRGEYGRARQWLELVPESVEHPLVTRVRLGVRYWSGQLDEALAGAWEEVRRARRGGVGAGVDRVLLRMVSIGLREGERTVARRALAGLEELYAVAGSPMAYEAVLLGRGLVLGDVESALAAHELVRRRGDLALGVDCCQCLTDIGDDPALWLAEATRGVRSVGMGPPVRVPLGEAARRRDVSVPRPRTAREGLSEADVRLIAMVSDGSTNRRIAARLACSEKTVEQRLTRLFQLTGCRSRAELAAAWLDGGLARQGLVGPSGDRRPE